MDPCVALVGSLDTKGAEYQFFIDRLHASGVRTILIDTGALGSPALTADFDRAQVAEAGGASIDSLVTAADRGAAMSVMAAGATKIISQLHESGKITGAGALGGTGGTSVASEAFRQLPLGFPKIILSTAASGETHQYIGESDLVLMPSVVDIAGLNRITKRMISNAAAALAALSAAPVVADNERRPVVAASMFGVTTPAVTTAKDYLESRGYEVIVFHMTGSGGRAMESLIRQGQFAGVLDLTTTELADHLVGGVFDAGEDRLTAAGQCGIPQVVSLGALDMVNFGPTRTVPTEHAGRLLYRHNSSVTLMRTTPQECRSLGTELATKLSQANGPVSLMIPLGGVSAIAIPGEVFYCPDADEALISAIDKGIDDSKVSVTRLETSINDPTFAEAAAAQLDEMIKQSSGHNNDRSKARA